ncbi:SusC/RagA family TonB-linked outer membrane protein [Chitinophaga sp. S165]|uniref:SusC/RagA family TonB-linked outer membrane protein n=1 Tax=Chitinophaga sp. S165 TaxID=2135462 RepID=UPI000D70A040|nr:SusC/RagA family TonB-linked outer membrane protein [Chitinophaga sp. S165]PWV55545.1 TonB-linked SusC/RagA family outer membrane protein [Chitinophaga sp. S165]
MAKLLQACNIYRLMLPLMLCLILSSTAKATTGQKDPTITFSSKGIRLKDLFKEIKNQTGFSLMYANQKVELDLDERVTVNFKKSTVSEVMEYLFKGRNLQWQIADESILLMPRKADRKENNIKVDTAGIIPLLSGRVTDADGKPVQGATVQVKGTQQGTTTDPMGYFILKDVKRNNTLLISSIGYEPRESTVKDGSILVRMNIDVNKLDETIVIGYGTTTKRFSTGNVSGVKAKDIERQPVTNPMLAIQGRVPGLFITQNTGVANGAVTVRIQGQNSIRPEANEPLIVVDGIPYPSVFTNTGGGGPLTGGTNTDGTPLSFINPAEIESIDVLKDADATAIYGSRGANGVILITTKKGKPGKTKLRIDLQQGWGKVPKKVKMLDSRQYLDMRYEAFKNDGIDWTDPSVSANDLKRWDTTRYTDWQKTLIGETAQYTNINSSISGGTEGVQYLIGATYNKSTTVFPGNFDDKRGSVHFSVNAASPNKKFQVQMSGSYLFDDNHLPEIDLTQRAIRLEPVAPPLYNTDGSLNWQLNPSGAATWENPLAYIKYRKYENKTRNLISNSKLTYLIFPGLEVVGSFGYNNLQSRAYTPKPLEAIQPNRRPTTPRSASYVNKDINSWIIEPQILYRKTLGMGKIDALIGMTIQQNNTELLGLSASGYASDYQLKNLSAATTIAISPFDAIYKYNAVFGRLNYNFSNKYIVNLTARRDGSSRFGERNRFHNFGSVGAAWIFTQEKIIQNNIRFLSFGKIRSSYGTTGNDQIGDYSYLNAYYNTFAGIPYQGTDGLGPNALPNPYIQWEETRKWQIGVDLGFFDDRIIVNGTYSINRSSNQITQFQLPDMAGFPSIISNFPASVQNTSWEFSLNSTNWKTREFIWTSNVNLTIPKNKVIKFPNIEASPYASGFNGVIVGQPLGIQKVPRYIGVDQATGLYILADKEGKPIGEPNYPDDYIVLVNTLPRFYGGFQNTVTWKGFEVDFLFQFVRQLGAKNLLFSNGSRIPGSFSSSSSNQPVTVLNRWQKPGDNATHARYNSDLTVIPWAEYSDAGNSFAASYIRLKNISLSWRFPSKWLEKVSLQNVQIYFQGQNIATITDFTGIDPESKNASSLPPLRIMTIGLRVEL